jgi:hypothetical protein
VGCEESSPVKAVLFTPSTTKSIAVNFIGGGANGAPTPMLTNDIVGVQLQGYWNNAPNAGSGDLPDPNADPAVPFLDSDGKPTTVTFNWASSGTWGAGTGADSPTQRLLNGLVGANALATPYTFTFANVPAGNHTILIYSVSPPLQFQTVSMKASGLTDQTVYMRTLNSDEYNAAPGFYRAISTDVKNPTIADFVRFDNVQPKADGTIVVTGETLAGVYDRPTGINAIQLVLNAPSPGAPPAITGDPQPTVVAEGGTAGISVTATGNNLTYQWRKDGKNLPNGGNISGATSTTLTIKDASAADEGIYSVAVFNPAGSLVSKNAALRLVKFDVNDGLVGYWKFNETSGTSAANAASGGKPATFTGTPAWGAGQVANAIGLDGVTYGQVADYTKATKAISASAWVKATANPAQSEVIFRNAFGDMIQRGGAVEGVKFGQFELRLAVDAVSGELHPESAIQIGPNVVRVAGPAALPTGSWHHVAFTADGAQERLYVDGVQVAVADYLGTINQPDIPYITVGVQFNYSDSADITSPAAPDPTNPNYFNGSIDELGLWTRVLTAADISSIYQTGKAGKELTTAVLTPPAQPDGTYKIGLNFGADQPNASLAATDKAGVEEVLQANWNNLSGQNGTNTTLVAVADGLTAEPTTVKVVWSSNNTWASTGGGEENNSFTGADKTLMTGYLDTTEASTTSVALSNLPAELTADGYDVYVYMLGGVANKGGGYRITDATGNVLKGYTLVQPPAKPTNYVEAPTASPNSTNNIGTYVLFTGLSSPAITIQASTQNGLGFGSTAFRAPINAIQLVSPSVAPAGPPISIAHSGGNLVITYSGKLQAGDAVTGPFSDVAGATSPYTVTPAGGAKFYIAVKP